MYLLVYVINSLDDKWVHIMFLLVFLLNMAKSSITNASQKKVCVRNKHKLDLVKLSVVQLFVALTIAIGVAVVRRGSSWSWISFV